MLFHSSLRKELARSFGATLVVLVTIVLTITLIRTLGQASRGIVNPQEVMLAMGYTMVGNMPPVLTLALFISIVGTLSRMYRDSEMAIWFTAGRGLASLLKPLLSFAWPVVLAVGVLALAGWPWSNLRITQLEDRYGSRSDLQRVAPGQFQESAGGNRVFFLDKDTPDNKSGNNVFIATTERGKEAITSARTGRVVTEGEGQFLVLANGQRIERRAGSTEMRVTEFKELGTRVGEVAADARSNLPTRTRSTLTLVREPTPQNLGELSWRLGLALAALNFTVIAIGLASVNPRSARSGHLLFALFTFVVYFNLLNLGQSWIAGGRVAFLPFLLLLHGGVLAAALLWLARQHLNWRLWPVRRAPMAPEVA
jgi:lipopolysaccharide export system permease protein